MKHSFFCLIIIILLREQFGGLKDNVTKSWGANPGMGNKIILRKAAINYVTYRASFKSTLAFEVRAGFF